MGENERIKVKRSCGCSSLLACIDNGVGFASASICLANDVYLGYSAGVLPDDSRTLLAGFTKLVKLA
jgi:hypothetical protein